jgi:hypothetical protein
MKRLCDIGIVPGFTMPAPDEVGARATLACGDGVKGNRRIRLARSVARRNRLSDSIQIADLAQAFDEVCCRTGRNIRGRSASAIQSTKLS